MCKLLTTCFRTGVVPTSFTKGILVPILKKPTLDPAIPSNYRPIIVSTVFSKIVEMYILESCHDVQFSDYQFGFVKDRGTNTAISLVHDVTAYCNYNKSSVFMCGLDVEGAFDNLPHSVLFQKCMHVIPELSWKLLYNWYCKITVIVKWKTLSKPIKVCKGTRQGGLTSPFMFNIFYRDLVDMLASQEGGITINDVRFNIFCYADDILLASNTASGLQKLINSANNYVLNYGICFNPKKTNCVIVGKNPFTIEPSWYIDDCKLSIRSNMEYLGASIGSSGCKDHAAKRISSCRKAFYTLQGAGLCKDGLSTESAMHVWSATCKSSLLYACETMALSSTDKRSLDKIQAKLLKSIFGIGPNYRTTPLLQALYMHPISQIIDFNSACLLNNIMKTNSATRTFYFIMMKKGCKCPKMLNNRVQDLCKVMDFNYFKVLTSENYMKYFKSQFLGKVRNNCNGTIDSIRLVLKSKDNYSPSLLKLLLKAF